MKQLFQNNVHQKKKKKLFQNNKNSLAGKLAKSLLTYILNNNSYKTCLNNLINLVI